MSSNMIRESSRTLGATVLSVLLLAGCGLSLKDKPPVPKNPNFQAGERAQCLSEVLPIMSHFVDGTASAPAVEQTWDCFRIALDLYGSFVRGGDDDRYTAREIATFFERYFLKDIKINDRLLGEIMKIKQILVGGDAEALTREELNRLINVAQEFKIVCLKLLPYMKVYSFHWKVTNIQPLENDVHFFEDANLAIQEAAKELARIIARNDKSYNLSNIVVVLEEMSKLYNSDWPFVAELKKVMPLVYKLKRTLAGGDEQSVASNEWRRFVLLGARGYIQFLRYYYFIKTNTDVGSGPEIIYFARSIDDLFSYLGDMVAEKPQGVFTRAELLEVLQAITQFIPEVRVSDPFLVEAMKLKRLFFGGNIDYFTPQDFIRARAKVVIFRNLTEKSFLYLPLYTFSWNGQLGPYADNQKYFKEADTNLVEVSSGLGSLIEDSYELMDLKTFAEELEKLYPSNDKNFSFVAAVKRYLPLVIAGKQVLFSDEQSVVNKDQWNPLLTVCGQALGRSLYYNYFLRPASVTIGQGDGLTSLSSFTNDTLNVLDSVIEKKTKQTIVFSDLAKLTAAAEKANMLPKAYSAKMLDNLSKIIFQKALIRPERRLNGDLPLGLSKEATLVVRAEYELWAEGQRFLSEEVFKNQPPGAAIFGKELLKFFPTNSDISVVKNELKGIYQSPMARSQDPDGRLVIGIQEYPYTLKSTDTINISRLLARVVMRTYAMDNSRIKSYQGITLDETKQLYIDLKPLLVAISAVEEKNMNFAESRFLEANLFTPRSNGDTLASFTELTDLVGNILSGTILSNMFVDRLTNPDPKIGCPKISPPSSTTSDLMSLLTEPGTNYDKYQISCLTEVYARDLSRIFSSLPNQLAYLVKLPRCRKISLYPWITESTLRNKATREEKDLLNEKNLDAYVQACSGSLDALMVNMLKAGGYVTETEGIANLWDISKIVHVMQYVEQMIQRFDVNHDGILDTKEGMQAYPVFKKTLSDVSGYSDDKTLRGLLAYFMIKGKPPETLLEKAYFYVVFRNQEKSWNIRVDRSRFAAIFAFIAEAKATKKTAIIGDDPTGETPRKSSHH